MLKDIISVQNLPSKPKNGKYFVAVCHDGPFHADDVFSAALLKLGYGENIVFMRTRNQGVMDDADIVFDTGRLYDGKKYFDHHQNDPKLYQGKLKHCALTLLAKAMIIRNDVLEEFNKRIGWPVSSRDNGYDLSPILKNFYSSPASWVRYFNRTWREQEEFPDLNDRFSWFDTAVQVAKVILERIFITIVDELEVMKKVRGYAKGAIHHGQILVLEQYLPYQQIITEEFPNIKFVIFPDMNTSNYTVCTIPVGCATRKERLYFPKAWRNYRHNTPWNGVHDDALENAVFVHSAGFIGVWKTKDSAIAAAKRAIKFNETD